MAEERESAAPKSALPRWRPTASGLDERVGEGPRATRPARWLRAKLPARLGLAIALTASCGGRVVSGTGADSGAAPRLDPVPTAELCNQLDDDGNGQVDERCACDPALNGGKQACYSGPVATRGTGICHAGYQRCVGDQEFHFWGPCIDEVTPQARVPGDRLDNDCDGAIDGQTPTPPPSCPPPATNYPACTTNAAGQCLNGMTDPPTCRTPASCVALSWTPDPDSVCSGTTFTQTSNCGTTRPASGTRTSIDCTGCGAFGATIGTALCGVNHNTGRVQPVGTTMPMTKLEGTGECPSTATCTQEGPNAAWRWVQGAVWRHWPGLSGIGCVSVGDYRSLALAATPTVGSPCTPVPLAGGLQFVYDCVPAEGTDRTCPAGNIGWMYCTSVDGWACAAR